MPVRRCFSSVIFFLLLFSGLSGECGVGLAASPDDAVASLADRCAFPSVNRRASCPFAPLPPESSARCARANGYLVALADACYRLPSSTALQFSRFSPELQVAFAFFLYDAVFPDVTEATGKVVSVRLVPKPDSGAIFSFLLRQSDSLPLVVRLLRLYDAVLREGASVALECATVLDDTFSQGEVHVSGGQWLGGASLSIHPDLDGSQCRTSQWQEKLLALGSALSSVIIPRHGWHAGVRSLSVFERIVAFFPNEPVLWLFLAEVQLQADMPQHAQRSSSEALRLMPGLHRARYVRGLAHWRMQQLSLAENDLTASLRTSADDVLSEPERARRLRARGAVRMLRRDEAGMCADFAAACAAGDCDGFSDARSKGLCQP